MNKREEILDKLNCHRIISENDPAINKDRIISIVLQIRSLLYPDYYTNELEPADLLDLIEKNISGEIRKVERKKYKQITDSLIDRLPFIQDALNRDIQAIYDGDPSVHTKTEIILSFPGFLAILCHRVAHELYSMNVPVIPRIISEYAHEHTGIDIHPGAQIGEYFCIDHGTGIVIGETAVIGNHVRIYHGVTLGVKKFYEDQQGKLIKGGKRHPNIGNHVVIYSNASIFGGDTYIEDYSVIKANSLITESLVKES